MTKLFKYYTISNNGKALGYNLIVEFKHLDFFNWILELEEEDSFKTTFGNKYTIYNVKIFDFNFIPTTIKFGNYDCINMKFTDSTASFPGYFVGI